MATKTALRKKPHRIHPPTDQSTCQGMLLGTGAYCEAALYKPATGRKKPWCQIKDTCCPPSLLVTCSNREDYCTNQRPPQDMTNALSEGFCVVCTNNGVQSRGRVNEERQQAKQRAKKETRRKAPTSLYDALQRGKRFANPGVAGMASTAAAAGYLMNAVTFNNPYASAVFAVAVGVLALSIAAPLAVRAVGSGLTRLRAVRKARSVSRAADSTLAQAMGPKNLPRNGDTGTNRRRSGSRRVSTSSR